MLLMLQYAFPSPVLHVCFRMLRCSMLLPAAERRPTVTPISCLEGRKCSFLLTLLLLFLWHYN